jgi:putative endonuclease
LRAPRQALGAEGEKAAAAALGRAGYRDLEANVRTPFGEIDLLARQGDMLCFVEVKTRSSDAFGHPAEAVTPAKQGRMREAASFLVQQRRWDGPCRFDVVTVTRGADGALAVEIIPDAFQ